MLLVAWMLRWQARHPGGRRLRHHVARLGGYSPPQSLLSCLARPMSSSPARQQIIQAALMSTPRAPCRQPWQLQNRTLCSSHQARHPRVPWMLLKARPNMRQPSSAQLVWGCISALLCHTPTGRSFDAVNATHPTDSIHNTAACSPNPDQTLGLSCACGAAYPGVRGGGAADGLLLT